MSDFGLMHKVASYKVGNREDLLDALRSLSDGDCDFNGENGLEYVETEAIDKGFESNQDFFLSELSEIEDEEEAIDYFLHSWLDFDNYYDEWESEIITEGKIRFISIAALTYC